MLVILASWINRQQAEVMEYLRWHRTLVAQKWDHSAKRRQAGRPLVDAEIVELIVKMARENPSWGYDRIQGALANLGHRVSDQTIGNVLKEHGIELAPRRRSESFWGTFLKSDWDVFSAVDFTTANPHEASPLTGFWAHVHANALTDSAEEPRIS
ncbi:MAG: helix-turn-helix domain-containing protein [Pirellulales bacterium]